ncbi:MAG: hypothetical protein ACXVRS_02725 [Gaiellaceae bacterium]
MKNHWERWAPLAGILAVACSVVGMMTVLNLPQGKDNDAAITAYFASHAHRAHSVAGFLASLVGILFLLVFLVALRGRLEDAEGGPGALSTLVFAAGVASAALWATSAVLAHATTFAVIETSNFRLDPNSYRLFGDAAYLAWVAALFIGALLIWATAAVVFRTGVLPRWYAWLGILAGASQLLSLYVFPFLVWWIWIALTAILLTRRQGLRTSAVAQPAH